MDAEKLLAATAGYANRRPALRPRLATIDQDYDPGDYPTRLPRVIVDGEAQPGEKTFRVMPPYWPHPGERVVMLPVGDSYLILGAVENSEPEGGIHTPLLYAGNIACGEVTFNGPGDFTSVSGGLFDGGRTAVKSVAYGPLTGAGATFVFTNCIADSSRAQQSLAASPTDSGADIRFTDDLGSGSSTSRTVNWMAVRGFA